MEFDFGEKRSGKPGRKFRLCDKFGRSMSFDNIRNVRVKVEQAIITSFVSMVGQSTADRDSSIAGKSACL